MGETNRKEESYAHSVIISCEKSTYDRDLHLLRSAVLSYLTDNHVLQVRLRYYVPLAYIRNEADILKFVDALISNTKGARPDRA